MASFIKSQKRSAGRVEGKRRCQSKSLRKSQLCLLHDSPFSDVTFIVGPSKTRIPCHQLFLKARSTVFEVMFSDRWSQDGHKEVLLEDVRPQIFQMFLEYVYAESFAPNVSEALELLVVAHKYDVQLLVNKCGELLDSEATMDDAVDVFQAARQYDMFALMDKFGDLITKHLPELINRSCFLRVDKETLMYILKRNDLKMKEVDLFRLALHWAKYHHGSTSQQSLEDILLLIRFPIMSLEDFTVTVVPTGLLSQSALIELFTYFGTSVETRKALASTLKFSTQQRAIDNRPSKPRLSLSSFPVKLYSRDAVGCRIRLLAGLKGNEIARIRRVGGQDYQVQDFGHIHKSGIKTFGDSRVLVGCITTATSTSGTNDKYANPKLIYKLAFKEC